MDKTTPIPNSPLNIPKGIPMKAIIKASKNTVFDNCFLVAPILANNPNCFFLSITEMENELYITIIQAIDTNDKIIVIIPKNIVNIRNTVNLERMYDLLLTYTL